MSSRAEPFLRRAIVLEIAVAAGLVAFGRFREALALTLGAAVAIVSAFWLASFVGRLSAAEEGANNRFDWKFILKALLRYALSGIVLWAALRAMPREAGWLLGGLSVVVLSIAIEGVVGLGRESGPGSGAPRGGR